MFNLDGATLRPQFRHTSQLILYLGLASFLLPCFQEIRGRRNEKKKGKGRGKGRNRESERCSLQAAKEDRKKLKRQQESCPRNFKSPAAHVWVDQRGAPTLPAWEPRHELGSVAVPFHPAGMKSLLPPLYLRLIDL